MIAVMSVHHCAGNRHQKTGYILKGLMFGSLHIPVINIPVPYECEEFRQFGITHLFVKGGINIRVASRDGSCLLLYIYC